MVRTAHSLTLIAALLLNFAAGAEAGLVDTPTPTFGGQATKVLFSIPGVMQNFRVSTYFACTSTSTSPIDIGVEVFDSAGGAPVNDATSTSRALSSGASVTFSTCTMNGTVTADVCLGTPPLAGSARIVATSKSPICHAFVADFFSSTPVSMTYLPIVAKTKQKAAN